MPGYQQKKKDELGSNPRAEGAGRSSVRAEGAERSSARAESASAYRAAVEDVLRQIDELEQMLIRYGLRGEMPFFGFHTEIVAGVHVVNRGRDPITTIVVFLGERQVRTEKTGEEHYKRKNERGVHGNKVYKFCFKLGEG
ncbi:hypothetical protein R1flu_012549 [Riccia fluitans]|uniref:Uncharacterized protein n=1 Tax=Riccia fluitans TaxID=41844 RepID=A0ABD1ZEA3_9MARC